MNLKNAFLIEGYKTDFFYFATNSKGTVTTEEMKC